MSSKPTSPKPSTLATITLRKSKTGAATSKASSTKVNAATSSSKAKTSKTARTSTSKKLTTLVPVAPTPTSISTSIGFDPNTATTSVLTSETSTPPSTPLALPDATPPPYPSPSVVANNTSVSPGRPGYLTAIIIAAPIIALLLLIFLLYQTYKHRRHILRSILATIGTVYFWRVFNPKDTSGGPDIGSYCSSSRSYTPASAASPAQDKTWSHPMDDLKANTATVRPDSPDTDGATLVNSPSPVTPLSIMPARPELAHSPSHARFSWESTPPHYYNQGQTNFGNRSSISLIEPPYGPDPFLDELAAGVRQHQQQEMEDGRVSAMTGYYSCDDDAVSEVSAWDFGEDEVEVEGFEELREEECVLGESYNGIRVSTGEVGEDTFANINVKPRAVVAEVDGGAQQETMGDVDLGNGTRMSFGEETAVAEEEGSFWEGEESMYRGRAFV